MKDSESLRRALKQAGLSANAIDAAWPSWWSDGAQRSPSAKAELRFTLARKLGLEPRSLTGDEVKFVWPDRARYKHLSADSSSEVSALSSFAFAAGRLLLRSTKPIAISHHSVAALDVRRAIMRSSQFVDLPSLLATCWGLGIPVIHLRIFPLETKSMHAMVVNVAGRYAILLGKDAKYPAPVAFTLAHEMGHISGNHVGEGGSLVDVDDPAMQDAEDDEEISADEYALELLVGDKHPEFEVINEGFGSRSLASEALTIGPPEGIEPGTLALCVGYKTKNWSAAYGSMKYIYAREADVWQYVNHVAERQLNWSALSDESEEYLRLLMGL